MISLPKQPKNVFLKLPLQLDQMTNLGWITSYAKTWDIETDYTIKQKSKKQIIIGWISKIKETKLYKWSGMQKKLHE